MTWDAHPQNRDHVRRLRTALQAKGGLLVFLGAGLSFGAARSGGRAQFDDDRWYAQEGKDKKRPDPDATDDKNGGGSDDPPPFLFDSASGDDWRPLPSWPWLVSRMRHQLAWSCSPDDQDSLTRFFRNEGPLDCAQLFRKTVGKANYREFLADQFDVRRHPGIKPSRSHKALLELDLPLLFTTNFDELIEDCYREAARPLRISATEDEFKARLAEHPDRHLIKLHGSIDRVETIVLTREDYSRARHARKEMLGSLKQEMASATFLFVGFSLSDPNFNLIRDDIRDSMGSNTPVSYTVQGRHDPVKERYLMSLDVNTVWLDSWNNLPDFLSSLAE